MNKSKFYGSDTESSSEESADEAPVPVKVQQLAFSGIQPHSTQEVGEL